MMSFYCFKTYKGEGLSENHQIWDASFMDGTFLKFIYVHVAMLSIEIEIWYLWYYTIYYIIFYLYNILHKI